MKKILLSFFICQVVILVLTGCVIKNNKFDIGKKSNVKIINRDILLSLKKNTLRDTGAILILKNDSDIIVQYGNPYEIEVKQNGVWHKINVELNFNLPSYELKSKESKEIKLNWKNGYGKLPKGEYRIIKEIDIKKEDRIFETFYVSAEFAIE